MRILFVSYSPHLGGAERILLDTVTGLEDRVQLCCPDGPLAKAVQAAGLELLPLAAQPLELRRSARDRLAAGPRLAAHAAQIRAHVAARRPQLVVAWNMRSLLSCTLALRVVRPRPALLFQHNDLLPGPQIGRAVRAAAGRADRTVALSRAIARDLDPDGRLPVAVVHPGVDLVRFGAEPAGDLDEVLVLGALVAWKRPDIALEAIALAARERPALRVTLAGAPLGDGDGELVASLGLRAQRPDLAGRVRFAGPLDDPRPALARAALLLHCAPREPFGMALVEALACARPVVAPAAAGPLEIVERDSGALYAPADASAAARALLDVLARLERDQPLGPAARARAEAHFDLADARGRWRAEAERAVTRSGGAP